MTSTESPKNTILVTGAAGYIGSVLVPRLLAGGYRVIGVDRFFFGKHTLPTHPELTLIREDTRCLPSEALSGVHCVIDLAALSNDPAGEYFREATWAINHRARARTARLARDADVQRYILPSSCSVYGFRQELLYEESPCCPLSHYARANEAAEKDTLALANESFSVTILRFATVFGYSPRMRFDLAVNRMLYEGWSNGVIPVLRDGTQYRPFLHIQDATGALIHYLEQPQDKINGEIFNIGSSGLTMQLQNIAEKLQSFLAQKLDRTIHLNWYGEPDKRSYQVDFTKSAQQTNWQPENGLLDGCNEILNALATGKLRKTPQTVTLDWYQYLQNQKPREIMLHGGILSLTGC